MPSEKPIKQTGRPYSFGPLYDFLSQSFPGHRSKQNVFDIPTFAADMGFAHETIYRVVRQNKLLKIGVASKILELSRKNQEATVVFWDDLIPFILPDFAEYSRDPAPDEKIDDLLA